jgi:hypothetical protein
LKSALRRKPRPLLRAGPPAGPHPRRVAADLSHHLLPLLFLHPVLPKPAPQAPTTTPRTHAATERVVMRPLFLPSPRSQLKIEFVFLPLPPSLFADSKGQVAQNATDTHRRHGLSGRSPRGFIGPGIIVVVALRRLIPCRAPVWRQGCRSHGRMLDIPIVGGGGGCARLRSSAAQRGERPTVGGLHCILKMKRHQVFAKRMKVQGLHGGFQEKIHHKNDGKDQL